jgi:hypothetical protein
MKNLNKFAYEVITGKAWLISKKIEAARKWAPSEIEKVDAETLLEIAEAARSRDTLEMEINKPIQIECLGEPRIIDTAQGPWHVLDVSLPDGTEHLVSLGHTVLQKRIAALVPTTGKRLVIMALGQPPGKRYFNYVVMTLEEYKKKMARKKQ